MTNQNFCSMCGNDSVFQEDDGFLYCYSCWKGEQYMDSLHDDEDPYDKYN